MQNHFKNEVDYIKMLAISRWGNKVICPYCEHEKVYAFNDNVRFRCAGCRKMFTAKTGTIFEKSKLPLSKWFLAAYLVLNHKKGISSHQLGRDLAIQQKTAWNMLQKIRSGTVDGIFKAPLGQYGDVEVDESFIGGKNKNRHWDKKVKNSQGRSYKDKTPILGMLERGGKIRVAKVKNTQRHIIQPIIRKNVLSGSTVFTDEWTAYRMLHRTYKHSYVNHGAGQYVDGNVHTNSIEGFWSFFKRSIIGIYHSVSANYLQLYAAEAAFRYNTRNMTQGARMFLFLHSGSIKKLSDAAAA